MSNEHEKNEDGASDGSAGTTQQALDGEHDEHGGGE